LNLKHLVFGDANRPRPARLLYRMLRYYPRGLLNYLGDFRRYMQHSATMRHDKGENLRAKIVAAYHNIEKGLSLPAPRPRFGVANLRSLLDYLYLLNDPADEVARTARQSLEAYVRFHDRQGIADFPFAGEIRDYISDNAVAGEGQCGGLRLVTRDEIRSDGLIDEAFFHSRHSIRQFTSDPVDPLSIEAAVRIAQKAPAVCNRQSGRVHLIRNRELIDRVLDFQGGARGFGQEVPAVMVITMRLTSFWNIGERNQAWIDGGLFAMSLILGLHSRAIGSCCLNWSRTNDDSKKLRRMLDISEDEVIIMLLAIGNLPERFPVPYSARKPVCDALRLI